MNIRLACLEDTMAPEDHAPEDPGHDREGCQWCHRVTVGPEDPDENPVFRAASHAVLRPYLLAFRMGGIDDEDEERMTQLLAQCYASGIMHPSQADPSFAEFTEADWERWLLADPDRFRRLRDFCQDPKNFED